MKIFVFGFALLAVLGTGFAVVRHDCSAKTVCKNPADFDEFNIGERCFLIEYLDLTTDLVLFKDQCQKIIHACKKSIFIPRTRKFDGPKITFITVDSPQYNECEILEKAQKK